MRDVIYMSLRNYRARAAKLRYASDKVNDVSALFCISSS